MINFFVQNTQWCVNSYCVIVEFSALLAIDKSVLTTILYLDNKNEVKNYEQCKNFISKYKQNEEST